MLGGGAAKAVFDLTTALSDQGKEVIVFTSSPNAGVSIEVIDKIKVFRVSTGNLYWIYDKDRQPVWKKTIWQLLDTWNPYVYFQIKELLKLESPDIVHFHKIRGLSPAVWSAAVSTGISNLVHTCHDYELLSPEGLFMGRVGALAKRKSWIVRPYQILRQKLSEQIKAVTAPSRYTLHTHLDFDFFPFAAGQVVPNTHGFTMSRLELIKTKEENVTKEGLRLLYIGRLDPIKGIDILCDAVIESGLSNITLDIVGDGLYGKALIEKFGQEKNIYFHGPKFRESEKEDFFLNADVVIVPSIVPEVFGIVITEAYAYGKPVIASKIGGIPELVHPGETGFLFEAGNVQELKALIENVYFHPDILKNMKENCYQEAKKYSTEEYLHGYQTVYQSL
jgi:glycosyltransferase involved in cell wall biosynthesis